MRQSRPMVMLAGLGLACLLSSPSIAGRFAAPGVTHAPTIIRGASPRGGSAGDVPRAASALDVPRGGSAGDSPRGASAVEVPRGGSARYTQRGVTQGEATRGTSVFYAARGTNTRSAMGYASRFYARPSFYAAPGYRPKPSGVRYTYGTPYRPPGYDRGFGAGVFATGDADPGYGDPGYGGPGYGLAPGYGVPGYGAAACQ